LRKPRTVDRYYGNVTSAAGRPPIGDPTLATWVEKRAQYLKSLCSTSQTKYFIDPVGGADANDGLDGIPKNSVAMSGCTWTESTKTLTKLTAFALYTWQPGDQIYISGGTAVTAGLYTIASKTSNNAIVLTTSIVTNGSNPTDVTASSGPKQTGTAVNTLLAAGGCRVLFKRGTVMGFATGLTAGVTNVSIGTYGTGPRAIINTTPTVYTNSGWTQATLNVRYTRARPFAVAAVKEQGAKGRVYARVATTGQVEALAGSWFDDGATLHVHHYQNLDMDLGTDPFSIEVFPVNSVDGLLVNGTNTKMLIEGVEFIGFGIQADSTTQGAHYGIHSELSTTNGIVCDDCGAYLNANHNMGATSAVGGTGGFIVCIGCEAGFTSYNDTPYVGYASAGGHEMYLVDCTAIGGQILAIEADSTPITSYENSGTGTTQMWVAHGNAQTDLATLAVNLRGRVKRGPMQCAGLGNITADGTTTDANLCRAFNIDCYFEAHRPGIKDSTYRSATTTLQGTCPHQIQGYQTAGTTGFTCVYINCTHEVAPVWMGTTVDIFGGTALLAGLHINGTFLLDLSAVTSGARTAAWAAGLVQDAQNLKANLHNCHIDIRGAHPSIPVGIVGYGAYNASSAATRTPTLFKVYDTIVTMNGYTSANAYYAAGNNLDGSAVAWSPSRIINLATNILYTNGAGDSPDSRRFSGATGTTVYLKGWQPGRVPAIGDMDVTPNTVLGGWTIYHDKDWNPRRIGTTAIGPIEAR